ncbi:MAG: hypothetical protein HYY76_11490 [Acidobacteria bacterium]|nr:hypothetical protein [Acidobacteriota bacterium]
MTTADRLRYDWKDDLRSLLSDAHGSLVVSSPYVTMRGAEFVLSCVHPTRLAVLDVALLIDLSPTNVAQASTDPAAVVSLVAAFPKMKVFHLPHLHAKVYVKDQDRAIVTSGNLTSGGLDFNYEYGLSVRDPETAAAIRRDVVEYAGLGASVPLEALRAYSNAASELRDLYRAQEVKLRRADVRLRLALRRAADRLVALRLARGPMHSVFASTILYLLSRHGPLNTEELHPRLSAIHPDLCDDSIDRVINGRHFGKKWKHAVRSAQQHLKSRNKIALIDGKWTLVSTGDAVSTRELEER